MDIMAALRTLLGEKAVITDAADLAPFETDWRKLYHNRALGAVLPETARQVAEIIKLCAAANVKIVPQGGNTGMAGGSVPIASTPQLLLNLRRMTKIRDFDPAGDSITVESGLTLQQLQETAAERGRLFPVSLGAEGTAQIGGTISTNAGGVNVLSYGNMRAQVLGLEVVLANGEIWQALRALRKDNTGYDLKQVFIGAEGTLGVITAACLKLHPAITARATALIGCTSVTGALALFQALRARAAGALTLCEYIAGAAMGLAAQHAGITRVPFAAPHYLLAECTGQGAPQPLNEMLESTLTAALENGTATDAVIAQSERDRLDFLHLREAIPEEELRLGGAIKHDIAVPIGRIPATVAAVEAFIAAHHPDCVLNMFGHIGDGNLHINLRPPAGQTVHNLAPRAAGITAAIEAIAMENAGSFSAEHGIGQARLAGMRTHKLPVELAMMRAIKDALDPFGLFNPGKVLPGKEESSFL